MWHEIINILGDIDLLLNFGSKVLYLIILIKTFKKFKDRPHKKPEQNMNRSYIVIPYDNKDKENIPNEFEDLLKKMKK